MTTNDQTYRLLWTLGLCLTMPMILLGGPLAGFLIGHFIFVKYFGLSDWTTLGLMILGLIGSGMQAYGLIQKLRKILAK